MEGHRITGVAWEWNVAQRMALCLVLVLAVCSWRMALTASVHMMQLTTPKHSNTMALRRRHSHSDLHKQREARKACTQHSAPSKP